MKLFLGYPLHFKISALGYLMTFKTFLPFTKISSSSNLYPLALGIQKSYYAVNYPQEGYTSYTQDEYASDGSMRETKSYAPGKSQVGQKNGIVTVNGTNSINEVRFYNYHE